MRILIAVSQDEAIGGVASVVCNLAQHLQKQGHEIYFFHSAGNILMKKRLTKIGFPGCYLRLQLAFGERHPVVSVLAFIALFPIGLFQLFWLIVRHKIQIVNVHYPDDSFFYFAICKRILPFRLITSLHGAEVFPGGARRINYSREFRLLLASSNLVVAPSRWFQQRCIAVFPELERKTTFIHNGINLDELTDLSLGKAKNMTGPYVLCISAYKEQKAIDVLVRAFTRVHEIDPAIKLVIVGGGDLRHESEDLANVLGIRDRIEFLGPKSRAEIATLLSGCKVFVLPSRFETFGIVILEAMACQKPVIATRAGGMPEIIENGKNGILVEPDNPHLLAEALITMLKDDVLRNRIASDGFDSVCERFRRDQTGVAYEAIFTELLANKKNQREMRECADSKQNLSL